MVDQNMENKVLGILEKKINVIVTRIDDENRKCNEDLDQLSMFKKQLEEMISNTKLFSKLDLGKIKVLFDVSDVDIKRLSFLQLMYESQIDVNKSQQEYIINILTTCVEELDRRINVVNEKISELNAGDKELDDLNNLADKIRNINSSKYFTSEELSLLKNIIVLEMKIDEVIEVITLLTNKSLNNIESLQLQGSDIVEEKEEFDVIVESNLDEGLVVDLFRRYNYDFNLFSNRAKTEILKYGNLENIDGIFKILFDNNILIEDYASRSNQIAAVLCFSNPLVVNSIIGFIVKDLEELNKFDQKSLNDSFLSYLEQPSIFIKKKVVKTEKSDSGFSDGKNVLSGAYENYVKNRELLADMGVSDINDAMRKCGTFFCRLNATNVYKKAIFDLYHVPREVYSNILSSFNAPTPMETMDRFIELGYFDYLSNNFSKITDDYNTALFYKIKRAQQLGIPRQDITYGTKSLVGTITNNKASMFGISEFNGPSIVNQYDYRQDYLEFSIYDDVIQASKNNGPLVLVWANFFINKIEEYRDLEDPRVYNFNGVIISRFKVLRIYETLISNKLAGSVSSVIYAVCKNSILTEEEFRVIESCINSIFEKSVGRDVRK